MEALEINSTTPSKMSAVRQAGQTGQFQTQLQKSRNELCGAHSRITKLNMTLEITYFRRCNFIIMREPI